MVAAADHADLEDPAVLGAVALSYDLPLAREGAALARPAALAATEGFAAIFLFAAACMVVSLILLLVMTEKPLEGRADRRA